jgi:polyisoprenoid-binding protein YceI
MTNYRIALITSAALFAGSCSAAETPAPTAAPKPVAAKPAAAPAATTTQATSASPHYVQAPSGNNLTFTFVQEGAANKGSFRQFATELRYDEKSLASSSLNVKVQIASVETQDKDRNELITGSDFFDVAKFPIAQYVASSFAKRADGGLEAVGKLTIRNVTHELRLPLTLKPTAGGLELSGKTAFKRLDYGVGQGEWKSTESVSDEVKIEYTVSLVRSRT